MHIHKIKPVHGWKEFFNEIMIIVVGVLIALSLEQVVEVWHWHGVVSEERSALRGEIGQLRGAMQARIELKRCDVTRLADIQEIIRRHDANQPLGKLGSMGRPLYPPTQRPIWDLAVADQSVAHMDLSEKRRFVEAYNWISVYEGITNDERAAFQTLQALDHANRLSEADWSGIRNAYERIVESHEILSQSVPYWQRMLGTLTTDMPDESVRHTPPVERYCNSMLLN